MKTTKIFYWIFTILICAMMLFSGIEGIINNAQSAKFMAGLGITPHLSPFLGVTKILGVIAILIPGFPKIKEWAYAGLTFDLVGATFLIIASGAPLGQWVFMPVFIGILLASYFLYHKKQKPLTA